MTTGWRARLSSKVVGDLPHQYLKLKKALKEDVTPDEIRHTALLSLNYGWFSGYASSHEMG